MIAPLVAALAFALPAPAQPVPRDPARLAAELTAVDAALDRAIARWEDRARGAPPSDVTLLALFRQRALRLLAREAALARATVARLPERLARDVSDVLAARRALMLLNPPISPARRLRIGPAPPAGVLLRWYRDAERRFGVAWEVLAAVNLVESAFGRVRSASSAGAQGPMQFLPATWRQYGLGGDVHDPRDAILGAANYLRASGAPRDYAGALFAYNRSRLYVDAVQRYAAVIRRDADAFLELYSWQVIVRTTAGDRRLTGPGLGR